MFRPLLFFICVVLCGCSPAPPQQSAPVTPAVDPATASSLSGHVTFAGAVPPAEAVRLDGDPKCVTAAQGEVRQTEFIVSNDGKSLGNVFVYIKDGLAPRLYAVPNEPVVLDQQKCRYVPRVLGIQVGQPLEIRNSDPLLHNVRAESAVNRPFDVGQPLQGIKTTHTFTTREVMIP